jgi:hypothetical protein
MVNGNRKEINLSAKTAKAELVAALKASLAVCDVAFDVLTDAKAGDTIPMGQRQRSKFGLLSGLVSHSNEEYGYLAVYLQNFPAASAFCSSLSLPGRWWL